MKSYIAGTGSLLTTVARPPSCLDREPDGQGEPEGIRVGALVADGQDADARPAADPRPPAAPRRGRRRSATRAAAVSAGRHVAAAVAPVRGRARVLAAWLRRLGDAPQRCRRRQRLSDAAQRAASPARARGRRGSGAPACRARPSRPRAGAAPGCASVAGGPADAARTASPDPAPASTPAGSAASPMTETHTLAWLSSRSTSTLVTVTNPMRGSAISRAMMALISSRSSSSSRSVR